MIKMMLVNNTNADIRAFSKELMKAVECGKLPEELQDVFVLEIVEVNGERRGILRYA
jgi:hypothetical protein